MKKFLICGLGNIGEQYELTRHNIGFLIADRLSDLHGFRFQTKRYADKGEFSFKGNQFHIIKPSTYMNLSGHALAYWMQELKIQTKNILVLVDDLALPFARLRLRGNGSAAGHNGLKHIEQTLQTQDYPRLRVGIGNNFSRGRQVEYVLSPFSPKEIEQLPPVMDKCAETILQFATMGLARAMELCNAEQLGANQKPNKIELNIINPTLPHKNI